MDILRVYLHYGIPANLQLHMLRVAALANVIVKNWKKPIHSEEIIQACLFHDIAKPIDFDLTKQSPFIYSKEALKHLKNTQEKLKMKYGIHEHTATLAISKEVRLSPVALSLLETLEWRNMKSLIEKDDREGIIPIYCDMRIGPSGILSLEKRMENLRSRTDVKNHELLLAAGKEAEKRIQEATTVKLNTITHEEIEAMAKQLRNYSFSPSGK